MTPALVLTTTACAYGLAPSLLRGRSRRRQVAEARAVAAFVAYDLTPASYTELARELGRARSTTVGIVSGVDERLRMLSPRWTRAVERVERLLRPAG